MATITGTTIFPVGVATWVRDCSDLAGSQFTINGVTYDINYCGDFGVYYVGRRGGWNAFLFEGPCKRTDRLTDYKYNKTINNTTLAFENDKYQVDINPTYELKTGWLSDEEAAIFARDLISTPKLYLHNLNTDEIVPALITNTSAEYKTFKNEGRKFVQYTVNVEESHTQIRK